jgi:hypothetical protein
MPWTCRLLGGQPVSFVMEQDAGRRTNPGAIHYTFGAVSGILYGAVSEVAPKDPRRGWFWNGYFGRGGRSGASNPQTHAASLALPRSNARRTASFLV